MTHRLKEPRGEKEGLAGYRNQEEILRGTKSFIQYSKYRGEDDMYSDSQIKDGIGGKDSKRQRIIHEIKKVIRTTSYNI